jgi:macrolide-specific efflux system membrane fusion protein
VVIAEVGVANAQRAVDQATLSAPIAGVVAEVNIGVGQAVSGGGASSASSSASSSSGSTHAIVVLTPGAFQVTGTVTDAQVNELAIGQRARILPAGSTEAVTGKVTAISPEATISSGVASFSVTVTLDGSNPALHAGSSASISVIVNQVVQVLTVPTSAVHTAGGVQTVQLLVNGQVVSTPVTVGASDPLRTQIISGVQPGDTVVVATVSSSVPQTTNGGGLFLGPGGGGGGFRRGGGGGGGAGG